MVPLALVRYSSVLGEFRVQTPGTRYSESVLSTGYTEVGYLLASAPIYAWLYLVIMVSDAQIKGDDLDY